MLQFKPLPSRKELENYYRYEPETGHLIYVGPPIRTPKYGEPAGTVEKAGYRVVSFKKQKFKAHRIVWLLCTGRDPGVEFDIDHIDGCRTNNRIENLRVVTRYENNKAMQERKAKRKQPPYARSCYPLSATDIPLSR
jgi:hypothetical protein